MKGFWSLYIQMFYKPQRAFRAVFSSDNTIKYAFLALLVPAIGYTLFYIMAYKAGGAPSTFRPWLALPIKDYFKYDIFLTIPAYYLAWIGASGTIYLISRLLNGKGRFDDVLAVVGFGIGIATWSSLSHDLVDAFLSTIGVIDMREYERLLNEPTFWRGLLLSLYALYLIWFVTLFSIGIRLSQGFGVMKSILIGFVGFLTYQVIIFIFIR